MMISLVFSLVFLYLYSLDGGMYFRSCFLFYHSSTPEFGGWWFWMDGGKCLCICLYVYILLCI